MDRQVDVQLTVEQKEAMVEAVTLAQVCSDLNKKIRASPWRAEIALSEDFQQAWGHYEELLRMMKRLIQESKGGSAEDLFKGFHEIYLQEYTGLKADVSDIYNQGSLQRHFVSPVGDEEIYTDLLAEMKEYEEKRLPLLADLFNDKQCKAYFSGLIPIMRRCFNFIKRIFFVAETSENFGFWLTPMVRVKWQAMMMVEKEPEREELNMLALLEAKAKDLCNLLGGLASEVRQKRQSGQDLSYEKIDTLNKFSAYIKNISEFLKSREMQMFSGGLVERAGGVLRDEEKAGLLSTIQLAIKGDEGKLVSLPRNTYLCSLFNIVNNMLEGLGVVEGLLDMMSGNVYELTVYIGFLKRYGLRLFLVESFTRLDRYNEYRRKLLVN